VQFSESTWLVFQRKFNPSIKLGLPFPWMNDNQFYKLEIYNEELSKQIIDIEYLHGVTNQLDVLEIVLGSKNNVKASQINDSIYNKIFKP